MKKSEVIFDVIEVLKEVADKFLPELLQRVRNKLSPRELKLLDYIFEHYYQEGGIEGRWYDPYHSLFSTHFAVQLVRSDEQVSPLIISAVPGHDLGYRALTSDAKANWNAVQNRIIHMQEGAALLAEILVKIGGYNAEEIGIIVGMVGSHDNIYLDIITKDPNRLAVRDADRMWVMHFLSFHKDWVSEKGNMSLSEFLNSRKDSIRGDKGPYTSLAKQWLEQQFRIRSQETQDHIIRSKHAFQYYAEKHIQFELKAGRA